MRILVDMNLTPQWCAVLRTAGHDAVHWSIVGDARAPDDALMAWARKEKFVVFTHDLDFGAILWATRASGPSVIQVRGQDVMPARMAAAVLAAVSRFGHELEPGALLVVDEGRSRVRILPFG